MCQMVYLQLPGTLIFRFEAAMSRVLICLTIILFAGSAYAQDGAPAHIAIVDGAATVDRDGESHPATTNAPFVPGDRLRTSAGRVEILFADGSAVDVDENSSLELQGPALLRVVAGRVLLSVAGVRDPAAAIHFQIDTPAATISTDGPGEYRLAVRSGPETELSVWRGSASLATDHGAMPV